MLKKTLLLSCFCACVVLFAQQKNSDKTNPSVKKTVDSSFVQKLNAYEKSYKNKNQKEIRTKFKDVLDFCENIAYSTKPENANLEFDLAEQRFLKVKDYRALGILLNARGQTFMNHEFLTDAQTYLNKSINYFKKSDEDCLAYIPINNLGFVFMNINDFKKAKEQALSSIKLLKLCKNNMSPEEYINDLNIRKMNLGLIYDSANDFETAAKIYSDLINEKDFENTIIDSYKVTILINAVVNKSKLLNTDGLPNIKKQLLNIDFESLQIGEKIMYYEALTYIAALQNNKAEAYKNIEKALAISISLDDSFFLEANYEAMVFASTHFKDYKNASEYQAKLLALEEKNKEGKLQRSVQELDVIYKTADLMMKNSVSEMKSKANVLNFELEKSKNKILWLTLAAGFLFTVFSIFVVFLYRKRSKVLQSQKIEIESKNLLLESLYANEQKLTRQLELSNKTIRKTFSIISHDLRNPFNALLGYTALLIDNFENYDDNEKLSDLKMIHAAAETNYNLTQNLLSWSLKQQGGYIIKKTENNLFELVNHCIKSLSAFIQFNNTTVSNKTENILVFVDKDIVQTILNNLLSNAIKNSKENTNVEIISSQENEYTIIQICNQYERLEEDRLHYIKNYLNSTSEEDAKYDIGFGLKISKEMADLHHAKIEFEKHLDQIVVKLILKTS